MRCWVTDAMCSTELMRRLPRKSSRCLTGSPLPSPEDRATAPAAAPAGELRFAVEPGRVADLAQQRRSGDGADAGLVAQGGAVGVEQLVDETFEAADLAASCAVLADERLQPGEPMFAGGGRGCVGVDPFEAAQPGFDLAAGGELVAHLGGQLGGSGPRRGGASKCEQPQGFCDARAPPRSPRRQGLNRPGRSYRCQVRVLRVARSARRVRWISRATKRLRQRMASFLVLPSATRRLR